jgi:hypothetical protein
VLCQPFHSQQFLTMSAFYSVSIPKPSSSQFRQDCLQQVAQITTPNGVVDVLWRHTPCGTIRQVVLSYQNYWFIQPDGNIARSIAAIFGWNPRPGVDVSNLFVFQPSVAKGECAYRHGKAGDNELLDNLTKCDWSDYALDRMVFQADMKPRIDYEHLANAPPLGDEIA